MPILCQMWGQPQHRFSADFCGYSGPCRRNVFLWEPWMRLVGSCTGGRCRDLSPPAESTMLGSFYVLRSTIPSSAEGTQVMSSLGVLENDNVMKNIGNSHASCGSLDATRKMTTCGTIPAVSNRSLPRPKVTKPSKKVVSKQIQGS